jgi:PAS domain S-box-containing protein
MDQKESEKEINHFYHSIIESESDAIITSDASKCIRSWNKGAERIFGYKKKEIIGKPITLIIPKIYHAEHDKGMDRLNNNKDPKVIGQLKERSGLRKNGTEFPIELTLGLWKDKGVNYYSAIIRDISKKKENEGLIQEQNKRFQVISSSKNDAIITSDETKRILSWNKGAEHIFGYAAEEAIGQPITLIIPKQLHERHNMGMDRMNRGEPPRVIGEVLELMAIKNDGEDFPIELTLGSWDNNGKKYYSGIIRDISEKKQAERILLDEKKRSDELLLNILPKQVADELKSTGKATTKTYENVTILFTDFKDFTALASSIPATKLVEELNDIFGHFDDIMKECQIEKIVTIGDAYLAACGLPLENSDHALRCIDAAKQMLKFLEGRNKKNEIQWEMRVGIHSGPVVAGVVGKKKYRYDLFGDTVNTASRIETNGEAGKINVSETTYDLIKGKHNCIPRGEIHAKGKGKLDMYFIE